MKKRSFFWKIVSVKEWSFDFNVSFAAKGGYKQSFGNTLTAEGLLRTIPSGRPVELHESAPEPLEPVAKAKLELILLSAPIPYSSLATRLQSQIADIRKTRTLFVHRTNSKEDISQERIAHLRQAADRLKISPYCPGERLFDARHQSLQRSRIRVTAPRVNSIRL